MISFLPNFIFFVIKIRLYREFKIKQVNLTVGSTLPSFLSNSIHYQVDTCNYMDIVPENIIQNEQHVKIEEQRVHWTRNFRSI